MATKAKKSAPDTKRLLEVLVRLHDDVRQIQYPYSAKVLKWGIISESEIEQAQRNDPDASEKTAWSGQKASDVSSRLAGALTRYVDQEGYREKWVELGMPEGSWKTFLAFYCRLKADSTPFKSDGYHRGDELENFMILVRIFDEEIFSSHAFAGSSNLSASLKSKWWKECHRVMAQAVCEEVYRGLDLPERPSDGICYTKSWDKSLQKKIRDVAKRWTKSPLWEQTQSTDPNDGVDFTSNNESTVKEFLAAHNFTSAYLEGR